MRDKEARKQIDDLQRQINEIRKKFSIPDNSPEAASLEILCGIRPCEHFYAENIKARFDEIYEFLKVERGHQEAKGFLKSKEKK